MPQTLLPLDSQPELATPEQKRRKALSYRPPALTPESMPSEPNLSADTKQSTTTEQPIENPSEMILADGQRIHTMQAAPESLTPETPASATISAQTGETAMSDTVNDEINGKLKQRRQAAQAQLRRAAQERASIQRQMRTAQTQRASRYRPPSWAFNDSGQMVDLNASKGSLFDATAKFTVGTTTLAQMPAEFQTIARPDFIGINSLKAKHARASQRIEAARRELQAVTRLLRMPDMPAQPVQTQPSEETPAPVFSAKISDRAAESFRNDPQASAALDEMANASSLRRQIVGEIQNEEHNAYQAGGPYTPLSKEDIEREADRRLNHEQKAQGEMKQFIASFTPEEKQRLDTYVKAYSTDGNLRPFTEGVEGSIGGTEKQIGNLLHLISIGYAGDDLTRRGKIRELAVQLSRQANDDPSAGFWSRLKDSLLRGVGSASIEVPKLALGGAVLKGATLPTFSALSEMDKGIVPAAGAALEGYGLHRGMEYVAPLGRLRAGVASIVAPAAYDAIVKGADPVDALGSNMTYGVLGGAGERKYNVVDPVSLKLRPVEVRDLPRIKSGELTAVPHDLNPKQASRLNEYLRGEQEAQLARKRDEDFQNEADTETAKLAARQSSFRKALAVDPYDATAWRKKAIEAADKMPLSGTENSRLTVLLAQAKSARTPEEKTRATRDLVGFITYRKPATFAEGVSAWFRSGLLSSLGVSEKNITANALHSALMEIERVPAGLADWAYSAATGKERQVQGLSARAFWHSFVMGQGDALKAFGQTMRYGDSDGHLTSKYDQQRLLKTQLPPILKQAAEWFPNTVFKFQGAQDAYFRQLAYRRSMHEQSWLAATNDKNGAGSFRERLWANYHNPSAQMQENALDYAAFSVFQKDSKFVQAVQKWKADRSPLAKTLLTYRLPFLKTGSNILTETLKLTGVPQALKMTKLLQGKSMAEIWGKVPNQHRRTFLLSASRAAVGHSLFWAGVAAASAGIATGISPDSDDGEKRAKQAAGQNEGSINFMGRNLNVNDLGPASALFSAGVSTYERVWGKYKKEESVPENLLEVFGNLVENSPLGSVAGKFIDRAKSGDYLGALLDPNPSKLIPMSGALRDTARLTDSKKAEREIAGDSTLETLGNQVKAILPKTPLNPTFNRESLPVRRDYRGQAIADTSPFDPLRSRIDQSQEPVNRAVLDSGYRPAYPKQQDNETRTGYKARRDAETAATNAMFTRAVQSRMFKESPDKASELESVQRNAFSSGRARLRPPSLARNADVVLLRNQTLRESEGVVSEYEKQTGVELTPNQREKVRNLVSSAFESSKMNRDRERSKIDRVFTDIDWKMMQNENMRRLTIEKAIDAALSGKEAIWEDKQEQ
jgi:hypothetical protein